MRLLPQAAKRRGNEHTHAHHSRIAHFDAHLGGAHCWIEDGKDVTDAAGKRLVGIGNQADLGRFANVNLWKIILVNVANNPYVTEIGDRERIWRAKTSHACGIGDLLIGDYT